MMILNFYYKIPPYNINKVFLTDFTITNKINGYVVFDVGYDFNNEIRRITFRCKDKNVQKLINNAKKSKIPTLTWDHHIE